MPRYFFHLRSQGHDTEDPNGAELPDIASAHSVVLDAIRRLLGNPRDDTDYMLWVIEVADEQGRTVLRVPFRPKLDA